MCGISGCVIPGRHDKPPQLLKEMVESQALRGPDATGYEARILGANTLWLAHNRLSIIDLSYDANQPMLSADGRYAIIFNGAIYNYVELRGELEAEGHAFRTSCDTEVLMVAMATWGPDALSRFHGMFAFAFHDREKDCLILARDRFGVKPLYYARHDDEFWFASTPHVLGEAFYAVPNAEYVSRGIKLKYFEDETRISPFSGIEALPPSHFLTFDVAKGELDIRRYYDLTEKTTPLVSELRNLNLQAAADLVFERLNRATEIRLRADVPIGISLSSGVDSTTISALCAHLGNLPHGYSFGDPSDENSEAPLTKRFAEWLGQDITFVPQVRGGEAVKLFWRTFRAQSAPFPHTSQMAQYAVFEAARTDGIKVMLGGQGGDEGFMGYRKFFLYQARNAMRTRSVSGLAATASNVFQVLPAIASRANLFWRERGRYSSASTEGLGSGLNLPLLVSSPSPGTGLGGDPRDRQVLDITRYSLPSLLRYEDRNSMGNSIESRLPMLDHAVMELGVALPLHTKLGRGFGKYALRKAMHGKVPDWILFNRDKRGFDTRHEDWIVDGIGRAIRQSLAIHAAEAARYLPGKQLDIYFSDAEMAVNASRFAEATSLLWLLDPTLESYPKP